MDSFTLRDTSHHIVDAHAGINLRAWWVAGVVYTFTSLALLTGIVELEVVIEQDESSNEVTYYTWTYRQRGDPSRYWRTCTSLRTADLAQARSPSAIVLTELRSAEQRLVRAVHDTFTD